MEGKDRFKEMRVNSGYSIRTFASLVGVSTSAVLGYESGKKHITSIPVYRAVVIFDAFHASLRDFLHDYYELETAIGERNLECIPNDPPALEHEIKKLKDRIYKRVERNTIDPSSAAELLERLSAAKAKVSEKDADFYAGDIYREYLCPVSYQLNLLIKPIDASLPEANRAIIDALYRKDIAYDTFGSLCGVASEQLRQSIQQPYGVWKMHVGLVYRICYLLDLDFEGLFSIKSCINVMKY